MDQIWQAVEVTHLLITMTLPNLTFFAHTFCWVLCGNQLNAVQDPTVECSAREFSGPNKQEIVGSCEVLCADICRCPEQLVDWACKPLWLIQVFTCWTPDVVCHVGQVLSWTGFCAQMRRSDGLKISICGLPACSFNRKIKGCMNLSFSQYPFKTFLNIHVTDTFILKCYLEVSEQRLLLSKTI